MSLPVTVPLAVRHTASGACGCKCQWWDFSNVHSLDGSMPSTANGPGTKALGTHGPLDPAAAVHRTQARTRRESRSGAAREGRGMMLACQ